ncbi:DNA cytosine methyltransferase, partial [Actinomadura geliboluensis]
MHTALSLGSMCTGYGGLDLAVSAVLDVETAWVADPDPGAAAILAHHWPGVPNLGDITAVDWTTVPPVDVVAAGFPCTDLSLAGTGAGITEGTQSGLWLVIAAALGVLRPRLVVLENVRAIVARRPGLDRVLSDLARLGFDAEWTCVRASDAGAAHQRWRWFLLAWPADAPRPRLQGPRLQRRAPGGGGAAAHPAGIGEREPADAPHPVAGGGHARPEPGRRGVQPAADPARDRRHQGRPEPARQLRGPDAALGGAAAAHTDRHGRQVLQRDQPGMGTRDHAHGRGPALDWGAYAPAIDRWARILGRPAPAPTEPGRDGRPRLSPPFVEWLMGLPAGWVTDPAIWTALAETSGKRRNRFTPTT